MEWTLWQWILMGARRHVQVDISLRYSEAFEKDTVALYCAAGGERTHVAMADDLEITGVMLRM